MKLTDNAIRLIDGKNFAFLSTLMPDGSPHVAPVWIDREGDVILVNTPRGTVKQRNCVRDPRVAIAMLDQSNSYESVVIRGRVIAQETRGAEDHIDKLAKKYTGADKYQGPGRGRRMIIKIQPTRVWP